MLRSEIARVEELRAAITRDPDDLDTRRQLAELFLAYDYDCVDGRRRCELALAEYRRILAIQRSLPDVTELDLLRTQSLINWVRHDLGEMSLAEAQADREEMAAACERVLGPHHPDTLAALDHASRRTPGLLEQLITGWEHVVADREQRLGPDHPETLLARRNLGLLYRDTRPEEAREQGARFTGGWDRIVAELTRRLGPVHPETVEARRKRATLTGDNPVSEAARESERIVGDSERILGPDHSRTLHLRARLVAALRVTDAPRAAALAEQIIDRVFQAAEPDWNDVESLRGVLFIHDHGRFEELWARYPVPADDDEEVEPGDPGYPADH